jgi:hypothetical protein
LEQGWRKIIKKEERLQLAEDVRSVIKTKLRRILKMQTSRKATIKTIDSLVESILLENPSFKELDTKDSISTYLTLCVIKMLKNLKN